MDEGDQLDRAFIAYSSKDLIQAEKVESFLQQKGIRTWRDKTNILPSSTWRDEIGKALHQRARAMILLWSIDASQSQEVLAEWDMMIKLGRPIFIIRLDDTEVSYRLASIQSFPQKKLEEVLPDLFQSLKPEFIGLTWLDVFPFRSEVERQFVELFNYLDIRWFYNPYPSSIFTEYEQPRFWLEAIEEIYGLEVSTCKFQSVSILDEETTQDISQLSHNEPILVGVLHRKVDMEAEYRRGKISSAAIWYVNKGKWEQKNLTQCQACYRWHLTHAREFSRRDVDDWEALEMYEMWCPTCKTECERCASTTSDALTIGGLCPSCQTDLSNWLKD